MKQNRDEAISETLKWEGGYSNDAGDPGGPTKYGITIYDVRKYVNPRATAQDVKNLTKQQAINIYQNKYWKTSFYDCDKLPSGLDFSVFDFGVNSGPSRAKRYLDQVQTNDVASTIIHYNDARLGYLRSLRTWSIFGKGWGSRVAGVKTKSLQMNQRTPVKPQHAALGAGWAAIMVYFENHRWEILAGTAVLILGYLAYKLLRKTK